jgi:predicted dehydrogenase
MGVEIGLAGYGAVAEVHARRLGGNRSARLAAVYGPNRAKAQAFAHRMGIPQATDRFEELLEASQAVIVASPTASHFEQARAALERGRAVLVELPPCLTAAEAQKLGEEAARRGLVLHCAHTSRYLEPYRRVREEIASGRLGRLFAVHYTRCLKVRERSWQDDALLHHTAHAADLFLDWFGEFEPVGALARPENPPRQEVIFLARGGASGEVALSSYVSYSSRWPRAQVFIEGEAATLETDGFSHLRRNEAETLLELDAQEVYESAIERQDRAFLAACQGEATGIAWEQTVRLMRRLERLAELAHQRR